MSDDRNTALHETDTATIPVERRRRAGGSRGRAQPQAERREISQSRQQPCRNPNVLSRRSARGHSRRLADHPRGNRHGHHPAGSARPHEGRRRRRDARHRPRPLRSRPDHGHDRLRALRHSPCMPAIRSATSRSAATIWSSRRSPRRPSSPTAKAAAAPATRRISASWCKLAQSYDIIHTTGGYPVEPIDIHASVRHLDCLSDMVKLTDKVFHCYSLGQQRNIDAHRDRPHRPRHLGRSRWSANRRSSPSSTTSSPLRLDGPMLQGIIEMSSRNQVVVVTPFTLAGAMAPVTIAGALVQQNAEALAGIAFTQMVRRGAPVDVWRLHLECRHEDRRARLRHAGIYEGRHRRRPAGPPLQASPTAPPTPMPPTRSMRRRPTNRPCRSGR